MSLINEALKKAEKNRLRESAPSPHGPQATRRRTPAGAPGFHLMRWGVAAVLFSCAMGAAIGFLMVVSGGSDPNPSPAPKEVAVTYHPAAKNAAPPSHSGEAAQGSTRDPLDGVQQLAMAQTRPILLGPAEALTADMDPAITQQSTDTREVYADAESAATEPDPGIADASPSPLLPSPAATGAAAGPAALRPTPEQPVRVESAPSEEPDERVRDLTESADTAIVNFLETSRVTGVKVAGRQSRVLLNNRVYRIDSVIHEATGLRITDIQNNHISLVDESGTQYRKDF